MSEVDNELLPVQDEETALRARADMMGVKYHPSISVAKLREKVNAALAGEAEAAPEVSQSPVVAPAETDGQRRRRRKQEATTLIRIRLTCMNPAKTEWDGEIFTAGNSLVGSVTKYVPFNADDGWHVPRIILDQILQRQCQIFTTTRDNRGNASRKGKLIKEFAVELLPPLTQDELAELARRQAMAKSID